MHAHFFQHVPFEGLGSIGGWLDARGATTTGTRFFEEAVVLPTIDDIDLLIVMGGPMSVNDVGLHPWLSAEKRLIAEAIARGKALLGVCLGAQLIADVLGARVRPNREREIGWFPIYSAAPREKAQEDAARLFHIPHEQTVFHWHGETFEMPPGAIHLAWSDACRNQAFQYGRRVIGLQFHLEITPQGVRDLVEGSREELIAAKSVQSAECILSAPSRWYGQINGLMGDVLSFVSDR